MHRLWSPWLHHLCLGLPTVCGRSIRRRLSLSPLHHWPSIQSLTDNCLSFRQNTAQMIRSPEALRINLVDILCPRGTSCEPSAFGNHLQPANGSTVTRCIGEDGLDFFTGQVFELYLLR